MKMSEENPHSGELWTDAPTEPLENRQVPFREGGISATLGALPDYFQLRFVKC
jgi:hypothetical protein